MCWSRKGQTTWLWHSNKTCSSQVDFNAATEYDAMNNYKVLQAAFAKMGIDKASHLPSGCRAPLPIFLLPQLLLMQACGAL